MTLPLDAGRTVNVPFRAYRRLALAALRSLTAYPMSFAFSMLASAFSALAMLYLWRAVLSNGRASSGFDWPHMKAYLLVTFVANSLVSAYTDYQMCLRIRQGDIAMDLIRPLDYQRARFAEACGFGLYEAGAGIGAVAVAMLIFGGLPAPSLRSFGLFLLSAVFVLPLRFGIVYTSGLVTFWTQNYVGVQAARIALVTFLSGSLVPLAFFPGWLRVIAGAAPFAGMASTPALIFGGQLQGAAALRAVGVQAVWTVALWLLARAFWLRASRQLTVNGG